MQHEQNSVDDKTAQRDKAKAAATLALTALQEPDTAKELSCSELWGGNRAGSNRIQITNLHGLIHAAPCAQAHEGGDVYYLGACSGGLTGRLCLADVVGHGDEVAAVSGWFHQVLRKRMNRINPAAIFEEVNERVVARGFGAMTTAICMSFDSLASELHYACAGHPPALLYETTRGTWRPLSVSEEIPRKKWLGGKDQPATCNLPLGVLADTVYSVSRCKLQTGDRLFLYSDGLLEAPCAKGAQFGSDRLLALLQAHHAEDGESLLRAVFDALRMHTGLPHCEHDDITLMLFEAGPRPTGSRIYHFVRNNLRHWRRKRA